MTTKEQTGRFLEQVERSITKGTFVKLSLGNYKGSIPDLKNSYIKRILIKKQEQLSFTYRYKTRDIVKNYSITAGLDNILQEIEQGFDFAGLFTTELDLVLEKDNKGKIRLKETAASHNTVPSSEHDRAKAHLITADGKQYLYELNITDRTGKVLNHAQDKFRQINHFIQIIDSLIKDLYVNELHKVVDMGSGKGYLSFALYDYLVHVLKIKASLTGVEFRKDLVDLCNGAAQRAGFTQLNFTEGTIDQYDSTDTDMLIALHACDTATDDAIWKGIKAGAKLIVVAPCCHKQVRREIEKHKAKNELDFLTKYGIFLERQAEMVTDGIRALILGYYGYTTKVFDFIADAHTPKNVMIVGIKQEITAAKQEEIRKKIQEAKSYFGIGYHHLERLASLEPK